MTLPTTTDVVLLHDGEIEPEDRRKVLEGLGRTERRHLRQLAALSEIVREVTGPRVEPPEDAVDRIVAYVAERRAREPVLLVSVPAPRGKVPETAARGRTGFYAGLLAVAAAVGLWLGGPVLSTPGAPPRASALGASTRSPPSAEPAAIEAVDFGSGEGTIFVIESETGRTPVVWLLDGAGEAAQAHPL